MIIQLYQKPEDNEKISNFLKEYEKLISEKIIVPKQIAEIDLFENDDYFMIAREFGNIVGVLSYNVHLFSDYSDLNKFFIKQIPRMYSIKEKKMVGKYRYYSALGFKNFDFGKSLIELSNIESFKIKTGFILLEKLIELNSSSNGIFGYTVNPKIAFYLEKHHNALVQGGDDINEYAIGWPNATFVYKK